MKLKLDENLPESVVSALGGLGYDVDTVVSEGFAGCDDASVWNAAQSSERIFITQDLDFSDLRRFAPGSHCGLVLVRLHRPGRIALSRRIREVFATELVARWTKCFVLITDLKVRVHPPRE